MSKRRNLLTGGSDAPPPPAQQRSEGSGPDAVPAETGGGEGGTDYGRGRLRAVPDFERDLLCCRMPLTDLGNAERWRIRFGDDFRFCPEIGWFGWDGRRWKVLSEEKDRPPAVVMQSVFTTVRAIRNEAALVAASGCAPPSEPLTDRELDSFEAFAEAFALAERDSYLRGDTGGERAQAVAALEPMDMALGAKRREMWSHKIAAWAKTSEGKGKLESIAALAKSFPEITISTDQLDTDRMAINVLNGTLRMVRVKERRPADEVAEGKSQWRTGGWKMKLYPHNRADLITKLAPVRYTPAARCPEYDAFIARVQPDETMRRFLHQWGGYSLVGDTTEHKLAFFYGAGRNGKGTWVEAVANMAGDYSGAIGIESLLDSGGQRRGDQATPDLAELPGVRFLRVSEPQKGMAFNDGLIKQLSGGDPVKARFLNKGFFQFFPDFKLTISGNTKPKIKDNSHGMWARMQLVPWAVVIPDDEIDRRLPEKLKDEASGILNRLLEGLLEWRDHGLIVPDQVKAATAAYRDDSDELGRFLTDLCEVSTDPMVRVRATDLFALYEAWAKASGRDAWKQRGFVAAMRDKGFEQKTSNGVWWVKVRPRDGITLADVQAGSWAENSANFAPEAPDYDDGGDPFDPDSFDA